MGDAEHVIDRGDIEGAGQVLLSLTELADSKREPTTSKLNIEASHSTAAYDVVVTRRVDRESPDVRASTWPISSGPKAL